MSGRPVFPELVTGRQDDFDERGWRVEAGWALRGHASCDFERRVLEVPLGSTPIDRVIRAHELMHVRVSPHDVNPLALLPDVTPRALECAEEFRVNELLGRLGFAVEDLADGSEAAAAARLADNHAWDEIVFFYAAIIGTGAERAFLRGLRRAKPEWAKALVPLKRRIRALAAGLSTEEIASTERPGVGDLPRGFSVLAVPLARVLCEAAGAAAPERPEELRQFKRSLESGGRRPPTGRFADLVLDTSIEYVSVAQRSFARRRRPESSGVALRYPGRLLTDPQRRAFARTRRRAGGIVLVDQSGSMDLEVDDLERLVTESPGATVIGYSHRPGDRTGQPNAWVVAVGGRRARELPSGNVGNGVDGPVLRHALRLRRSGDPVIWVTDGQVTDSNDHPSAALARECADLVRRHRIRLVRTLGEAADHLARPGRMAYEEAARFGRVGRELADSPGVTGPG